MRMIVKGMLVGMMLVGVADLEGLAGPVWAQDNTSARYDLQSPYQPSEHVMADVDTTLVRAQANGKLAMIVLGANWCHDSIGYIKHLNTPEIAAVLDAKYEVQILDVGFLEHGKEVVERFGLKVIFGTPTVLIIDPASETLLNADTVNLWRDAAAMPDKEVLDLLANQPITPKAKAKPTAELKRLLDEIDAFEAAQAARIYKGFAVVGPMLAADDRPEEFGHFWGQLRTLRYAITEDLTRLRKEAHDRTAAGETDIVLTLPEYPAFDWEK